MAMLSSTRNILLDYTVFIHNFT